MPIEEQLRVFITDYASHEDDIRNVREDVFIDEQQIAREDEWDDRDNQCIHAVAYCNGLPVGTGRIDVEKGGKVGRLAVKLPYRRHGIGRAIMQQFEDYAVQEGLPKLWFHAQQSAVAFYESLNYEVVSEQFYEAGIPHVVMEKSLCNGVS